MRTQIRVMAWMTVVSVVMACGDDDGDGARDASAGTDAPLVACTSDEACDDGLYCTGAARCRPSDEAADARGCVHDPAPCPGPCDELERRCGDEECPDADGDGYRDARCGGDDCDDSRADVNPGAVEVCDPEHVDEDCDPSTIAGAEGDVDMDGFVSTRCCNTQATGALRCGLDCDDARADVHPGALDICNGRDDDCDGVIDEDPNRTFYEDVDGDSYGVESNVLVACSAPPGYAVMPGDCNDMDRHIHPAATEICDGVDNNCSGTIDDAPSGCACLDASSIACGSTSNVGACRIGSQSCVSGVWQPCVGAQGPEPERCSGQDDDCDGLVDDEDPDVAAGDATRTGARRYYRDADGDGHGDPTMSQLRCAPLAGWVLLGDDCDDSNPAVSPSNSESSFPCDGIDNDCDGRIDEASSTTRSCYRDADGDGYGVTADVVVTTACACPAGRVTNPGDCVDNTSTWSASIHPGATTYRSHAHCNGGMPCTRTNGRDGCVHPLTGSCSNPASFDWDCDGQATPQPPLVCPATLCRGRRGPTTTHPATSATDPNTACGTQVGFSGCTFSCVAEPTDPDRLPCR